MNGEFVLHDMVQVSGCAEPVMSPTVLGEYVLLSDVAVVLPGPVYMDPPDGGDIPVLEQLRRMAEDAARYRAMRNAVSAEGGATLDAWADRLRKK